MSHSVEPGGVIRALASAGVELGQARFVTRTLLDTFDGRVHAAGMRLEFRESHEREVVLSRDAFVLARESVPAAPRWESDLPSGRFTSQLVKLINGRALLPTVQITARCRHGELARHDEDTAAVAELLFSEDIQHVGRIDPIGNPGSSRYADPSTPINGHGATAPTWTLEITSSASPNVEYLFLLALLEHVGIESIEGDTVDVVVAAAGVDLGGYSNSPNVLLDPQGDAIDGFRACLAVLAAHIESNWQGTIDRVDHEFLHDLRIAVRGSRAILKHGAAVLPADRVEQGASMLKAISAVTGPARDLDVCLRKFDWYTRNLPRKRRDALQPAHARLVGHREVALRNLVTVLQSPEITSSIDAWREWLMTPLGSTVSLGPDAGLALGAVVRERVLLQHKHLITHGRRIDRSSPAQQLHDLRKSAKTLRYLLESFAEVMVKDPLATFVKPLEALQRCLGIHQDLVMHAVELTTIARDMDQEHVSRDCTQALEHVVARLERKAVRAREKFYRNFGTFDSRETRRAFDAVLGSRAE